MTEEQRKKYLLFKEQNKEKFDCENDILYKECIELLQGSVAMSFEDTNKVFLEFEKRYPISLVGSINWDMFNGIKKMMSIENLHNLENQSSEFFILWDKKGVPCVKSKLNIILEHLDDVLAVSFNTWLLSINGEEIIEFYHEGRITYGKCG